MFFKVESESTRDEEGLGWVVDPPAGSMPAAKVPISEDYPETPCIWSYFCMLLGYRPGESLWMMSWVIFVECGWCEDIVGLYR